MPVSYVPLVDAPTPEQLTQQTFANLAARIDGWQASSEGVLDVALVEELSRLVADLAFLAQISEPARVFRGFGTSVAGVARRDATAAEMTVRLTLSDAGSTAPAGVVLVATTTDGLDEAFTTTAAVTAPSGATTVQAVAVASEPGQGGNGVPPGPAVLVDGAASVVAVEVVTASTGGSDAETDDEYLSRLVAAQSLLTRSVVLAADAAIQARSVDGIHRAFAVDDYDAETGLVEQERTVSVFVVDESGGPVTAAARAELVALLESLREVNFVIRVADPTYAVLAVAFTAHALPRYDPAAVQVAAIARVFEVLNPATWAGGAEDPPEWTGARTVRFLDLAAEIDRVTGVDFVDTLTINGTAGDVQLGAPSARAVLPASQSAGTTVTGTVVAAGS